MKCRAGPLSANRQPDDWKPVRRRRDTRASDGTRHRDTSVTNAAVNVADAGKNREAYIRAVGLAIM